MSDSPAIDQITLRAADGTLSDGGSLESCFGAGPWLVVAPHDDDAVLGMGAAIAAARAAGIEVHIVAVTNGRMGWWEESDRATLVDTRAREMTASSEYLGVGAEQVHFLGFPDGALAGYQGCRPDEEGPSIGRKLVALMRRVRPATVFSCTGADLHPDHRITRAEVDMAICWAASRIWSEFGEPIEQPARWDYAVYCAFPTPPDAELLANAVAFDRKVDSMDAYQSQVVIAEMKQRLRDDGPYEYLQRATWQPFRPALYKDLFARSGSRA